MSKWAIRTLCAVPLMLLLNATGCQLESVHLELPGFFSTGVDELWFWRRDEASNVFVRVGHLRLGEPTGPVGDQRLPYTIYSPSGVEGVTLDTPIQVIGDSIRTTVWFGNWTENGVFKVSARNLTGESALSSESLNL